MSPLETDLIVDQNQNQSSEMTEELRQVCQSALLATKEKRTGQKFNDMRTEDHSVAMQRIVGEAQHGVDQSFGKMSTLNNSWAFQGQMDSNSFAVMFSK